MPLTYDPANGQLTYSPGTGQLALCGDPCALCAAATPNATVTINGACAAWCATLAGAYTFLDYTTLGTWCYWRIKQPAAPGAELVVAYHTDSELWCSQLANVFYAGGAGCGEVLLSARVIDSGSVSCVGGALVGSFDLTVSSPALCDGCTASVTLT